MMKKFMKAESIKLNVYSGCKYTANKEVLEDNNIINYHGVIGFEVIEGEQAKEIETYTDESCIDDNHEYFVLYFENGETSTFRNSYVDMFFCIVRNHVKR